LVYKLTQPIPEMRLGSGPLDSQQHITELENDPWFIKSGNKKINHMVYQEEIPMDYCVYPKYVNTELSEKMKKKYGKASQKRQFYPP
jgi:hypothetical protein